MIGRLLNMLLGWLGYGRDAAPVATDIPDGLANAIAAAVVTERSTPDDDGAPRVVVRVVGCGSWQYEGTKHAAERIARHWDNLPPATCRKAARLLADVIARRQIEKLNNSGVMQPEGRKGRSWVNSWEY